MWEYQRTLFRNSVTMERLTEADLVFVFANLNTAALNTASEKAHMFINHNVCPEWESNPYYQVYYEVKPNLTTKYEAGH